MDLGMGRLARYGEGKEHDWVLWAKGTQEFRIYYESFITNKLIFLNNVLIVYMNLFNADYFRNLNNLILN